MRDFRDPRTPIAAAVVAATLRSTAENFGKQSNETGAHWRHAGTEHGGCCLESRPENCRDVVPGWIGCQSEVLEGVEADYSRDAYTFTNQLKIQSWREKRDVQAPNTKHEIKPNFLLRGNLQTTQFSDRQENDQKVLEYVQTSIGPCCSVVVNTLPRNIELPRASDWSALEDAGQNECDHAGDDKSDNDAGCNPEWFSGKDIQVKAENGEFYKADGYDVESFADEDWVMLVPIMLEGNESLTPIEEVWNYIQFHIPYVSAKAIFFDYTRLLAKDYSKFIQSAKNLQRTPKYVKMAAET